MALSTIDRHLQEGKLCTILIWCLFLKSHPLGVIRLTKWTKPHSLALQGTYSLVHACKHVELKEFIHTQFFFFFFFFVVNFVIHWNETAMGLHVFPIPIPPPTSLSTRSLQVFPEHQVWALVSCIQPGLVICFTLDNIRVSMLFSWNLPTQTVLVLSNIVVKESSIEHSEAQIK